MNRLFIVRLPMIMSAPTLPKQAVGTRASLSGDVPGPTIVGVACKPRAERMQPEKIADPVVVEWAGEPRIPRHPTQSIPKHGAARQMPGPDPVPSAGLC